MPYDPLVMDRATRTKVNPVYLLFANISFTFKLLYFRILFIFSIVVYEGGDVVLQARSLWRLELARTKWAGGFINWLHPMRIRHITTGRYLGINDNKDLCLLSRLNIVITQTSRWQHQSFG